MGASPYLCQAVKFGILDLPNVPFKEGLELGELLQCPEDIQFFKDNLMEGCLEGIYDSILYTAMAAIAKGCMIPSTSTV